MAPGAQVPALRGAGRLTARARGGLGKTALEFPLQGGLSPAFAGFINRAQIALRAGASLATNRPI